MIPSHLIVRYLHGDLSLKEQKQLEAQLSTEQDAQEEMRDYEFIHDHRDLLAGLAFMDLEKEWEALSIRLDLHVPAKEAVIRRISWRQITAIAASMAVLIAASLFLMKAPEYITITDEIAEVVELPDGSTVSLQDNSSVTYRRAFLDHPRRSLSLKGDARFDVESMPEKPFIVQKSGAEVEVLGTIFDVRSLDSASEIENIEGKVRCSEIGNLENNVTLLEGDRAIWDGSKFSYFPATPPYVEPGSYVSLFDIIDTLADRHESTLIFASYMDESDKDIFVNLDQDLPGVIHQLDSNAILDYAQDGRYFTIRSLRAADDRSE